MARPKLDYKKICREQELEIRDLKVSVMNAHKTMEYAREKIDTLKDQREAWERQAVKFSGVIDYLEEKLEEQKEINND